MSAEKFTPGPWRVHTEQPEECSLAAGHYIDAADGSGVAFAQRSPEDAHLIAAAPEMYEVLQRFVDTESGRDDEELYCSYCNAERNHKGMENCALLLARAALARARGEPAP